MTPKTSDNRYLQRGASATKDEVHAAVAHIDKGLFPGAFCKIVPDTLSGDEAQCLIMHADGAGTKSSLAYLYWKETGDRSVFHGIAQDAVVMNTDDLLCVGAIDTILISSTIGRHARRVPGEVIAAVIEGMERMVDLFAQHDIRLIPTGGETADVGDLVRTLIVDATAMARMRRDQVIDNGRIRPGQVIVGLASDGQSAYESEYNSGMGSNGLTSARHDVFHHTYAEKYPETFDETMAPELVYSGKALVTDRHPEMPIDMGRAVLSPTRTYAPVAKVLFKELAGRIHGLIHCSGGAQTKCKNFGHGVHYIKDNLFVPPPLFRIIRENSQATWREMYQVFNMGHRLEVYVDPADAQTVVDVARSFNIAAQVVGRCESTGSDANRVTIHAAGEVIEYE